MSQKPNRGSFQPGVSGNPGGKPAAAQVSALARRYTHDWMRALVEVVRLPPVKEFAAAKVAAARELREVGYPGLTKGADQGATSSLHLHLLAVSREAQAVLDRLPGAGALLEGEAWDENEPPLDPAFVPEPDSRLPHEALPLWDAADATDQEETSAGHAEPAPEGDLDSDDDA